MPYTTILKLVNLVNWNSRLSRCSQCGAPIPAGTRCILCGGYAD